MVLFGVGTVAFWSASEGNRNRKCLFGVPNFETNPKNGTKRFVEVSLGVSFGLPSNKHKHVDSILRSTHNMKQAEG